MSGALSALRPIIDTDDCEHLNDIGRNPMHDKSLDLLKKLSRRKRYRFSKMWRDVTKKRYLGINMARKLFPKKRSNGVGDNQGAADGDFKWRASARPSTIQVEHAAVHRNSRGSQTHMAWVD